MAETRTKTQEAAPGRGDPVLRPGRPADPAAPGQAVAAVDDGAERGDPGPSGQGSADGQTAGAAEEQVPEPAEQAEALSEAEAEELERRYAESYQRKLRRLLRQCERVNLMDFNILSLGGWPDSYTLNAARRRRDSWLLSATIAALVFLSGMTGFVPAWIAGGGFGAFVVILLLGLPFIRRLYSSRPSYLELILRRQQLLSDARRHVAHLEGEVGLIWQCNALSEFNPTLASPRFSTLRHLSEQRRLASSLTRREHFRLYLIFMLEAEKAYERMQHVYFEQHQKAIDRGWYSVAQAVTEASDDRGMSASTVTDGDDDSGDGAPEGPAAPGSAGSESGKQA